MKDRKASRWMTPTIFTVLFAKCRLMTKCIIFIPKNTGLTIVLIAVQI